MKKQPKKASMKLKDVTLESFLASLKLNKEQPRELQAIIEESKTKLTEWIDSADAFSELVSTLLEVLPLKDDQQKEVLKSICMPLIDKLPNLITAGKDFETIVESLRHSRRYGWLRHLSEEDEREDAIVDVTELLRNKFLETLDRDRTFTFPTVDDFVVAVKAAGATMGNLRLLSETIKRTLPNIIKSKKDMLKFTDSIDDLFPRPEIRGRDDVPEVEKTFVRETLMKIITENPIEFKDYLEAIVEDPKFYESKQVEALTVGQGLKLWKKWRNIQAFSELMQPNTLEELSKLLNALDIKGYTEFTDLFSHMKKDLPKIIKSPDELRKLIDSLNDNQRDNVLWLFSDELTAIIFSRAAFQDFAGEVLKTIRELEKLDEPQIEEREFSNFDHFCGGIYSLTLSDNPEWPLVDARYNIVDVGADWKATLKEIFGTTSKGSSTSFFEGKSKDTEILAALDRPDADPEKIMGLIEKRLGGMEKFEEHARNFILKGAEIPSEAKAILPYLTASFIVGKVLSEQEELKHGPSQPTQRR